MKETIFGETFLAWLMSYLMSLKSEVISVQWYKQKIFSFNKKKSKSKKSILLVIHVGRVPQRERDDLIAQALLVVDHPVGPDDGVRVSVD